MLAAGRVRARHAPTLVSAVCLALAGCGSTAGSAEPDGTAGQPQVVAAFYPLQYVAEQVGGDLVTVDGLTQPGIEPHDLELTPRDVVTLGDADLVVLLTGFQPAVDDAAASLAPDKVLDAGDAARLVPYAGGDSSQPDPHFWLDPTRLADVGSALADRLATIDAEHAGTFTANANRLRDDLAQLDSELSAGLASCTNRWLVVSHASFGYLADRYDFRQQAISGLSPADEPSARDLADIAEIVRREQVRTVYVETLVSGAAAETIAAEAGARTDVLDPIEAITASSQGDDYPSVMRANLANLRSGQPCP